MVDKEDDLVYTARQLLQHEAGVSTQRLMRYIRQAVINAKARKGNLDTVAVELQKALLKDSKINQGKPAKILKACKYYIGMFKSRKNLDGLMNNQSR